MRKHSIIYQDILMACFKQDTDNETSLHVEAEIRRQALEDELADLKDRHEQVRWQNFTKSFNKPFNTYIRY